jgi:hypothetical protein
VNIAGITFHPEEGWVQQMSRNVTMEKVGALQGYRYLLHEGHEAHARSFRAICRERIGGLLRYYHQEAE